MELRSAIHILDQPQANSAQHLASGRFKIDSVGDISQIGQVWVHAVFVSGVSGYFLTDAPELNSFLYVPPPPPKPLIYPSFIDKLPAKEAAKRHQLPGVQIGMTEDQVLAGAWGVPIRKKIVRSSRGLREEWHYPHDNVLIFEDGVLEGYEK
jgi:hypothetical protein